MSQTRPPRKPCLVAGLLFLLGLATLPAAAQKKEETKTELPPELGKAKVYRLPEDTTGGETIENLIIYKNLSYQDINFERLALNLFLSVKPVDRAATIRKVFFQDIRVNGVPVHLETFDQEFKLSKKEVVDLPAPLKVSIVFSDLDSLKPVKEIVDQDKIRITGRSFIEVKLNVLEKIALRSKQLVLPVDLNEEVPLQMFSGNPLLQAAASKTLDVLSDPASTAAIALAKEHLAKLAASRNLASAGQASVYLLYCEYSLRNPKTEAREKFSQTGTGFVISADGKLLTAKRVIQPWKFDPQIAYLIDHYHLELDPGSYKICAWAAGAQVLSPQGWPDSRTGLSTEKQTLKVLKTAPDAMEKREFQDPETGERGTLSLHSPGVNDVALLQLVGNNFQPLVSADPKIQVSANLRTALLGFPFGLNRPQADPQVIFVKAAATGPLITLDHPLNPGESGAPLLVPDGKVLGLAGGTNECIPFEAARALIQ